MWLRSPAEPADLGDRQNAVGHQEHRPEVARPSMPSSLDRRRRCSPGDRDQIGPLASGRSASRGRIAASSRARQRPRAPQPGSSVATSWTARTCLHGPRSPRWRPYHGHVQRPAVRGRAHAILDATGARDPRGEPGCIGGLDADGACHRRAGGRRGVVAGVARCDRDRTAARGGRSRPRPGRSRRCPTARARRAPPSTSSRDRPVVAASASTPSRGSHPSAPRTAAMPAATASRRPGDAGPDPRRRSRARPPG